MGTSRRNFLSLIAAAGAAALWPEPPPAAARPALGPLHAPSKKGALTLQEMHKEHFEPHVGTAFQVRGAAGEAADLELTEASATGQDPRFEQFSLLFSGPAAAFLPQGTYEFSHPALGSFALFIVPIGQGAGAIRYQAVFNRFRR